MDRLYILRTLMAQKKLKNYLEIGVFNGHIFFRVKSNFKIAVDPKFQFGPERKLMKTLLNPYNIYNRYFEKKSDDFFTDDASTVLSDKRVQLSLIDGMHEYDYVLRDIENTLRYLSDDGVILVHDCNPVTKDAACSFEDWEKRNFTGVWNGDVWKSILHLRCFRRDITTFVLDCDNGIGVITKNENKDAMLSFSKSDISNFSFEDFDENRKEWLGLKQESYFFEFFKTH